MKNPLWLLLGAMLLLAGCDSMSSRMTERFTTVPPHSRTFAADRRTVYFAAQAAVKKAGLFLSRSSVADWSVEGYAPIRASTETSDARQTTIAIKLSETDDLQTKVDVLVWNQTEGSFPGGVSATALKEHSLYESYFAALQQILQENGSLKPGEKP